MRTSTDRYPERFLLSPEFLRAQLTHGPDPKFGFSGLGETVFVRSYSRVKDDGSKETFRDVAKRVVEGAFGMQLRHAKAMRMPWDEERARKEAEEMYVRMIQMKFLPPGRGLVGDGNRDHRGAWAVRRAL